MSQPNKQMISLREHDWPEDMKPSEYTISTADIIWEYLSNHTDLGKAWPNISAAADNSIDFFWGDRKTRVLLNVASDNQITLNYIDGPHMTMMYVAKDHIDTVILPFLKDRGYI